MKWTAGIFWVGALAFVFAAEPAAAQANGGDAAASEKTIWDSVYTDAQATRGQRTAQQNCMSCHAASEWSSSMFLTAWSGRPVRDLHNHLRMTMPYDAPGKLTAEQYSEIVAYMLKLNNAPTGDAELPSDDDGLKAISVTRAASR
jgi:mono/diheme cytochrome c family protein